MFGKLLKNDWRSIWRTVGVMCLAAVFAGFAGALAIRGLGNGFDAFWAKILQVITLTMVFVYFVGFGIGSVLMPLSRFYKSRFGDEGYLTHTLPVNTHGVLLSSLVSILGCVLLAMVSICFSALCLIFFGAENFDGHRLEFLGESLPALFRWMRMLGFGNVFVTLLAMLVQAVNEVLLMMFSLTVGASFAQKNKILLALLVYFGMEFLNATLMMMTAISSSVMLLGSQGFSPSYPTVMLMTMGWNLLWAAAQYFIMYYLSTKRLNLA